MTQYLENYKKNIVIDMRKKGYSYSEIQNSMNIPKSTIAFWLRDIKLTGPQTEKLKRKQIEVTRANSEKRKLKTSELILEIKNTSSKDIDKISKKELWLMGIMLYWRERLLLNNENDLRKGVNFTSSDPYLIKFFIKWLKEVGNIENEEIGLDIFIKKGKRENKNKNKNIESIIAYWSDVTEFPEDKFSHIYFQKKTVLDGSKTGKNKNENKKGKEGNFKRATFGLLRVRVRASSMLARQISGWMRGVQI